MAQFSTPKDVKDPALAGVSTEEDHAKAERAIRRELILKGYDPETLTDDEALKDLSVNYACWQRCIQEMCQKDDAFSVKAPHYKAAYESGLRALPLMVDETPRKTPGGGSVGSADIEVG